MSGFFNNSGEADHFDLLLMKQPSSSPPPPGGGFLLTEDGNVLETEDGDNILLE